MDTTRALVGDFSITMTFALKDGLIVEIPHMNE